MKINIVMLLIALAIAALAAYGFYTWNKEDNFQLLLTIGSGVMLFITFSGIIAVKAAGGRGGVGNIRVLSIIFLIASIISNIIFSFINLSSPAAYIITNGIIILIYILIGYTVFKAIQSIK